LILPYICEKLPTEFSRRRLFAEMLVKEASDFFKSFPGPGGGVVTAMLDMELAVVDLQRFPALLVHSVIHREAPWILALAHVLVGEPDATSPGHALASQRTKPMPRTIALSWAFWIPPSAPHRPSPFDSFLSILIDAVTHIALQTLSTHPLQHHRSAIIPEHGDHIGVRSRRAWVCDTGLFYRKFLLPVRAMRRALDGYEVGADT
jgi:hypothetical protein